MTIRNAVFNEFGSIDCEVEVRGVWRPFTASEDDSEAFGRQTYADALLASPDPYVAPEPEPEPTTAELLAAERAAMVVSRFQAKAALMQAGHLPAVEDVVAQADAITQLAWAEAVELRRNSPMIAGLAGAVGFSDTELDDLFRAAAQIEA